MIPRTHWPAREECEAEAKRISDQIDDELRSERVAFRKQEQMVKILLLGQSGSGKSTVLKRFRMQYARDEWVQERPAWRTVLQLNLVQSLTGILTALQDALDNSEDPLPFSDCHNLLRLRLRPLIGVEGDLKRLLAHKTTSHDGVNSQNVTKVIASCKNDIIELWGDQVIHKILQRERGHLEGSLSDCFLDNAERLAARDYEPTDNDIIRACLPTLDIEEYELDVESDDTSQMWKIYDFGGSCSQRHAWLPYFDHVNAIIFLAPISCFDERAQEVPRVNRLEDSFILWKAICASKLLSKTTLIIFLNKIDILSTKIANGAMVKRYLPSYGDRPNDTVSVIKYLCQKFKDTIKHSSPRPRPCHIYPTSAIVDTRMTAHILMSVRWDSTSTSKQSQH